MPFEIQSLDTKSPFAPIDVPLWSAGYRDATPNFRTEVIERSSSQISPDRKIHRPSFPPEPPPDPDRLWRWLRKAGYWLLTLAIEGFAQYAGAMYACPYPPDQGRGGDGSTPVPPRDGPANGRPMPLWTFSDHLLRDIGVARDQIDGFERDKHFRE